MRKIDRTGEINFNTFGSKMTVIRYKNHNNMTVEFECGYKVECTYYQFSKGEILNVYDKTVYKVGYIGEGKYKTKVNNKQTIQYEHWKGMLRRCYDEKSLKKNKTYIGKTVCDEWLNFQNFAMWFDENYYEVENETMCVDKDILTKGNKIYSQQTCLIVPSRINSLFIKCDNSRGDNPLGVRKNYNKYDARCSTHKKSVYLGIYRTKEEAFEHYKEFKENYIKKVADSYKGKIPKILYNAMYNWKVEITD